LQAAEQQRHQHDAGGPGHLITRTYLESKISDFDQHFYICGPESFMESVAADLDALGAKPEALVFEQREL